MSSCRKLKTACWALLALAGCTASSPPATSGGGTGGAGGGTPNVDTGSSGGAGGAVVPAVDAADLPAVESGGMIDAPSETPSGTSDGPVAGSCTGAIACDDFEGNATGTAPAMWTVDIGPGAAGTVLVDATRAFSGTRSLRITLMPRMDHNRAFITRALPALPNNTFYGRMMIWVVATPPATTPGGVHWDNIRAQGFFPGTTMDGQYNYGGGQGTGNMMANYWTKASDCWKSSARKLTTGKWACVEWLYNGAADEMHYWLDSEEVMDLAVPQKGDGCFGPNLWRAPPFQKLSLGWYNAQPSTIPIEMWMDDVAVDTKRIGCPPSP